MADPLKLLFELDADGEPSVKEFERVKAAFAAEIQSLKQLATSAVKTTLNDNRAPAGPGDGAIASKATLDAAREVNRQLDGMWSAREKAQSASLKKQADIERAFGSQQVATSQNVQSEIAQAYKDRESQLAKVNKQSEDAWAKHENAKLKTSQQAEKEGEAAVAASNAAKDKIAKQAADNFLKLQKQTAATVARANAQTAANEIREALVAAKGTANVTEIASKGIESLGEHLNLLVGHRIPLAGGAFVRLSENVRGFVTLSKETEGSVLRLGNIVADLGSKTGKSAPEIKDFLSLFANLGSQAEKDEAAISAFGPALAQKLTPQLAAADAEMGALAASTEEAGSAFAGLAGPVGVAVLVVAAVVAAAAEAVDKMFELAKASAEFSGKFEDLNQQTGISTEILSALAVEAATTGSDIQSLSQSFVIFQKHLEEARDPMSTSAGLFNELGIKTLDTESALRQTFETLARMPVGFKQTALAQELFGRSGKSVLAIIKETGGNLDEAIKKFRALGLIVSEEDAKAADKFNDELEILDREFKALTVTLGREFLPASLEIVHALSDLTKESKPLFALLGTVGKPIIDQSADSLRGLAFIVAGLNRDLPTMARILRDIQDRGTIKPIEVPDLQPVPLPGPQSALEKAREESRLVRAEVSDAIRFAESQLGEIDRRLQLREVSPSGALEPVIALERAKTEAVIKGLNDRREVLAKQFAADQKAREQIKDEIAAIDQDIANEESRFQKLEADKRAAFRAQQLQIEQQHRRALADIFLNTLNDRIAAVTRAAQTGTNSELFAQDVTTELLKAGFDKRKDVLERERAEAGKDPALAQQINSQLEDLQRERTTKLKEQSDRRIEILRNEEVQQLDIQRSTISSILRTGELVDSSRINAIKALAALRVKTEEQASRDILKIRLDAIDREKSVALAEREVADQQIATRLDAFSKQRKALETELNSLPPLDKRRLPIVAEIQANLDAEIDAQKKAAKDRTDADTDLNNKLRVLGAERLQIEDDGNREIEQGRQDDLDNLRRYFEGIENIERDIADITRETQHILIDIMIGHKARRTDIIKAQRDLELKEEADRHRRVTNSIKAQESELDTQIRILESHLKSLKLGTTAEIEEHERLIQELEKLRIKREGLKAQQDAEDKRNRVKQQQTNTETGAALQREDPNSTRSLFGDIFANAAEDIKAAAKDAGGAVSDLTAILAGFGAAAEDHFHNASLQAGNFVSVLLDGVDQINAGLGDMLENWILTGDTGSAALRKLLAGTLAYYSKTFLIKALDNIGEGFSNLAKASAAAAAAALGVPGAAAAAIAYHDAAIKNFISAAKYGLASAGAAAAGRLAAGNSFNQKDTASRAVNGGEAQPNNRQFNSNGQAVESSSQAAREGSGGPLGRLAEQIKAVQQQNLEVQRQQQLHNAMVSQALTKLAKLDTARPGDVVTAGASDARGAIAVAVIDHSNASGDFNERLQRNLGVT